MHNHPLLDEMLKDLPSETQTQVRTQFAKIVSNLEFVITVPSFLIKEITQKAGDMGIAVFCLAGPDKSGLYGTAIVDEEKLAEVQKWINQVAVPKSKVLLVVPERKSEESMLGRCKSSSAGMGIPFNNVPCIKDASFIVRIEDNLGDPQNYYFCTSCFRELMLLCKNLEDKVEQTSPFAYILHFSG